MRAIYLMARREYLSYVATWGFWLSLLSIPFFMAIGGAIPLLAASSQPDRYYVVIDETGLGLDQLVERAFLEGQKDDAIERLRAVADTMGRSDAMPAVIAAIKAEPGLEGLPEAISALDVPVDISADQFQSRFIQIEPPARDVDGLQPYLLGEQTIMINGESQPVFAAIFFRDGGPYGIEIDYWSTNLTSGELKDQARRIARNHLRSEAFEAAGISEDVLAEVNSINPGLREWSPERGRADAAISNVDRIPIIVGIGASILLWVMIFSVTNMLLTAMIEEKGNKILETLLATARFHEILVGKLAGLAAVSATFILVWGGLASSGLFAAQNFAAAADLPIANVLAAIWDPGLIIPAIGYFVVGYLMYGTIYLAIGSLCDTLQEAQSLMSPIIMSMMVPFLVIMVTMESPDSMILKFASWVPIWTPFLMLARLQSDPSMVEIIGTTILMVGTAVGVILLSSYVFRLGSLGGANASSIKKMFGRKKSRPA
ncbi:MAG: hypothetical protein DHS20C06_12360 [Hyphobacterium sp.]|nr:MAG: hypothetical protein DHS20C06_12360 [Hyphobacterium sp.]